MALTFLDCGLVEVGYLAASEFPRADASIGPYKCFWGGCWEPTLEGKLSFAIRFYVELIIKLWNGQDRSLQIILL